MSDTTCALSYLSHGDVGYTMYENEDEAVSAAVWMADDGYHAFPAGIQYSDGTYTPLDEWAACEAEQKRLTAQAVAGVRAEASRPRPATRGVKPPFDTKYDQTVTVPAHAPSWLGRQP